MNKYQALSQTLSWLLHPFILPVYMVVLVLTLTPFALYPLKMKFYLTWVVALYTLVIPVLSLGVLRRVGYLKDFAVDTRRERILPLLIGAVCYMMCAITISKIPSAEFLRKFMVAAACCETMCLAVTLRWKISLHLTGMGAVVAMLAMMNIIGIGRMYVPLLVAILLAGALASARLCLGRHNGWQIFAGFIGGFAISSLAMLFL